uniref:DZF domain-containing protein n=1 Tax=Mesocestoides corti TaxID=53468 RepID=A0A5K3FTZ3_MESCO
MTMCLKSRLFIREYRPGQTFPANSDVDALCRDTITNVLVESFMKAGTIKKLLNLSETTLKQIVIGRLHQLEILPGMVYLAGFTQMEPDSPLEDLLPDVSGVTFRTALGVPTVAGIDDPKCHLLEELFEVCGLQAGPIRGDERCLRVMLASALHCTTAGHDRIRLILQMEKKSIEDTVRLGYAAVRSINTSVVIQGLICVACRRRELVPPNVVKRAALHNGGTRSNQTYSTNGKKLTLVNYVRSRLRTVFAHDFSLRLVLATCCFADVVLKLTEAITSLTLLNAAAVGTTPKGLGESPAQNTAHITATAIVNYMK